MAILEIVILNGEGQLSQFQFGFFIEPLDKVKNAIKWGTKCMGGQGQK